EHMNPVSREPYSNSSCPTAQSGIDYAWQFPSLVIRPRVRPTATRGALPGGIMSTVFRVGFAVCLLLVAAATSWAQDGVITGRITDTSGATLPGVDVSLTGPGLLGGRSVGSDEQGSYRFALLPPGVYSVRFQLQGFATVIREGITLTPGFTSSLNISLEVASVAETVTVVGESPIIDVTNAVVASNFNKELTAVLPTGHDVFSVLAVNPGVQPTPPAVGGSRAGLRAQFRGFGGPS